ncbi:Zn-ribbon domain-containing OB-fold protein [Bacteroidota bacterium]
MITSNYHREIPQRYRLEANKCSKCGKIFFPPRDICNECSSKEFENINLSDKGKIITFTIIRVASNTFSYHTPYAVGIIELNDGVRVTAQIADIKVNEIQIGQKVKLVFRLIHDEGHSGIHCYGYKAIVV